MDCFRLRSLSFGGQVASLAKTLIGQNTTSRSRGADRPEFSISFALRRKEGAGKTGCALHPRSHGQWASGNAPTSIQVQRRASGLPCAMALRLIRGRLVTGFLATIAIGNFRFRRLDASTGASDPHDFAVRCRCARLTHCRVHRSLPHVRDDGQRPSAAGQDARSCSSDLRNEGSGIFLRGMLDAFSPDLPVVPFGRTLRHCERSETIHSTACGDMDCFRLRSLSFGGQVASLAMMVWTAPPKRHQVPKRGCRSATKERGRP